MTTPAMPRAARLAIPVLLALLAACASGGGSSGQAPAPASSGTAAAPKPAESPYWPIKTREHVDLWLHGFAMLMDDTARVPFFRRGYRDQMVVVKNRANVTTQLDANRDRLRARLFANPALAVNAQFLAQEFGTWAELKQGAGLFLEAQGNVQRAGDQQTANVIGAFASVFPGAADRDWLKLYLDALDDESTKYWHSWWIAQQRERTAAIDASDSLWQKVHRPRLQGFLNNSRFVNGSVLLSIPLYGEGRTVTAGARGSVVAVPSPATTADALEPTLVFVHEAAGQLAEAAVRDNITPAEARAGAANRLQSAAAVRTGYLVLARIDPTIAPAYADYYLRSVNAARTGASTEAALAAAFPLPDAISAAIGRQLDVILGGI